MPDLKAWVRETVPTLTDEQWKSWHLARYTRAGYEELPVGISCDQADALFAYVRELADRAAMLQRRYGGNERFRNEVGLTPLYYAVFRVLEEKVNDA